MSFPVNHLSSEQWGALYNSLKIEPFKKTVITFIRIYRPAPELELARNLFVQFAIREEFALPAGFNSKSQVADAFFTVFSERKVMQTVPYIGKMLAEKQWKAAVERVRSIEKDIQEVRGKINSLNAEANPHFDFKGPLQTRYGDKQKEVFDQLMEIESQLISAEGREEDGEDHPNHAAYLALLAARKRLEDQFSNATDELQAVGIEFAREEVQLKRQLSAAFKLLLALEAKKEKAERIADLTKATFQAALLEFENFSKGWV